MRISDGMVSRQVVRELQDAQARLAVTQERSSTGRQINRPSDDPAGAAYALQLRSSLEAIQQHRRSVDDATSFADATDSALSDMGDVAARARELLVQAGNSTVEPSAREAIASELDALVDRAKDAANARLGDRYVFAGTATATKPYATGSDAYQGDAGSILHEIGPGVTVAINQNAGALIGSGGGDGKLIDVLRSAAADLRAGTTASLEAVRTTDLRGIERATEELATARTQAGGLGARLAAAGPRLDELGLSVTKLLSETQDADMSRTLVDLAQQQSAYQSALRAGATLISPTLLDFLR